MSQQKTVEKKLSKAAIESLAIIVYHQPVTRAEIEEIRGVDARDSGEGEGFSKATEVVTGFWILNVFVGAYRRTSAGSERRRGCST